MTSDRKFTDLTNTKTILFNSVILIGLNWKLKSLLTPSFYKIQSLISVALSTGITSLLRGKNRLREQPREC